ncbi:MAG: MBL fold metallo-hydrolase [bacterium]
MVISYLGKQCFKITQGDLTIVLNPPAKDSKFAISKFGADIVLSSTHTKDFNGGESFFYGEKEPFIIDGPGSYEVKGLLFEGVSMPAILDGKTHFNTMYTFELDGIRIVFLGALTATKLSSEATELLNSPDLLFVPIGGKDIIGFKDAAKISVALESRIAIPMDYGNDQEKDALTNFLKETGQEKAEKVDKLTLKRKDVLERQGAVIVISE